MQAPEIAGQGYSHPAAAPAGSNRSSHGGNEVPEASVTGGLNPRIDGEACAGEDKGAVEAPGLINGMAIQSDGLSVASSV
jgi:hypothetical protein